MPATLSNNEDGSCCLVVKATLIPIPDERRDNDAEQKSAHGRSPHADPAPGCRHDAHPEHNVSDAAARKREKHDLGEGEYPKCRECVVVEERHGDKNAEPPVDNDSPDSTPWAPDRPWTGLRQPESFSGPALPGRRKGWIGCGHASILFEPRNMGETLVIPSRNWRRVQSHWLHKATATRIEAKETFNVQ